MEVFTYTKCLPVDLGCILDDGLVLYFIKQEQGQGVASCQMRVCVCVRLKSFSLS